MEKYTEWERNRLIAECPSLGTDTSFEITSDDNPLYNCIGFAMGMKDVWVALGNPAGISWCWWPPTAPYNSNPKSLIEAFKYFGFEECPNGNIENGYDKVALYSKNGEWTHAAIVEEDNLYHSKMGMGWDIVHRGGDLFHNEAYGDIYTFMKRLVEDRHLTDERKPKTGIVILNGHRYAIMIHDERRYDLVQIA